MKTAVIYYSHHHGNTKKVLDAIAEQYPDVTLIDAAADPAVELSDYDLIGFASGIYFSQFHNTVLKLAQERHPGGQKRVFIVHLWCESGTLYQSDPRYYGFEGRTHVRRLFLPGI